MRVVAGEARGRRLAAPGSERVRPTADRVKEALFSILTSRRGTLHGCRVLDLFAGTGSLGIEALSRGARSAVFVDSHAESCRYIHQNLATTGLAGRAKVLTADARTVIAQLAAGGEQFDLVFFDPPYDQTLLLRQSLVALADASLLAPGGIVVVETVRSAESESIAPHLHLVDSRNYGTTTLLLLTTDSGE